MSSVYADVIVDITNEKLDRTFQYKVPPELTGEIGPGTAVQIPFGNGNRTITGYVLSVGNEPKYPQDRMKAILAVQKDAATVETKLIALAAWMRHTYGSTMIQWPCSFKNTRSSSSFFRSSLNHSSRIASRRKKLDLPAPCPPTRQSISC